MYLEFVKGRFRKKHLEKIKEFICKEGLQGSSGFGKTGLLNKKHSYLKGKKQDIIKTTDFTMSVYGRKNTVFSYDFHIYESHHVSSH